MPGPLGFHVIRGRGMPRPYGFFTVSPNLILDSPVYLW
jgi:hypothetical protein